MIIWSVLYCVKSERWGDLESQKSINMGTMGYTVGNAEAGYYFSKCSSNDVLTGGVKSTVTRNKRQNPP